ncbi:polysaccharide deacetylase family protein [Novosphingobium mangrovi (ex Huang et al. 2023)]|uniref:Polysaccharide deacetylase family protein n=1 Tax=Novosphingobium mangrovi (ex Huang et al. 2023) TaxID=2976432 RepID=A0ABT2I422_9SPHN|nr:polysaccharide deacetylase family protein [Novosphingobium mangrovi (ex Huang et al. 2023)]MCT2399559.1 polysaccharide deacetylase family protein [Novosphingobium mangrovi (ex Huang et al. 2023)]
MSQSRDEKRLLASIHDVGPGSERQVEQLHALLSRRLGGPRFAMLVVPDHWGNHPLSADRPFQSKLRAWSNAGIEMFVHGWFHRDAAEHSGAARFKAQHMTAGEGEFLGLDHATALRRMRDGKALIEDVIGRETAGFIAPAWLYGDGARTALREAGFALAEDHWRVWNAQSDAVLAKGPVITWASRSRMRTASSLAFAALARQALPLTATVRIAVHPGDVTKDALLASIDSTLKRFARTHRPSAYADIQ